MNKIVLRDYQEKGTSEIMDNLSKSGSCVAVSPTGSGKTIIASEVADRFRQKKNHGRIIIGAPRVEHENQFKTALGYYGIKPTILRELPRGFDDWWTPRNTSDYLKNIVSGGRTIEFDPGVIVSTTDTLISRIKSGTMPDDVELVIGDEIHHFMADSYEFIFHEYPYAKWLGFTATPWRTDNRGLGDRFDTIVVVATYDRLRKDNAEKYGQGIVDSVVWEEAPVDLSNVDDIAGDYHQGQLEKLLSEEKHTADVVKAWKKRANGLPTAAYSATIKSAKALEKRFQAEGVTTRFVHTYTDDEERKKIMSRVGYDYTVLVNVGIATEGTDIPQLHCIVVDRPTKSRVLWRQIAGRGFRPFAGDDIIPKKEKCIIIESGGCAKRLGLPDDDVGMQLYTTEEKKVANATVTKPCKECGVYLRPSAIRCFNCGAGVPKPVTIPKETKTEISSVKKFRKVERETANEANIDEQPSLFSEKPKRERLVTGPVDKFKVSEIPLHKKPQKINIDAIRRHPQWKLGSPELDRLGYSYNYGWDSGRRESISFNVQRYESNYKGVYRLQFDPEETTAILKAIASLLTTEHSYTSITEGGRITKHNLDEYVWFQSDTEVDYWGRPASRGGHGIKILLENCEYLIAKLGIKEKERWNQNKDYYPKILELKTKIPDAGIITLNMENFRNGDS